DPLGLERAVHGRAAGPGQLHRADGAPATGLPGRAADRPGAPVRHGWGLPRAGHVVAGPPACLRPRPAVAMELVGSEPAGTAPPAACPSRTRPRPPPSSG